MLHTGLNHAAHIFLDRLVRAWSMRAVTSYRPIKARVYMQETSVISNIQQVMAVTIPVEKYCANTKEQKHNE